MIKKCLVFLCFLILLAGVFFYFDFYRDTPENRAKIARGDLQTATNFAQSRKPKQEVAGINTDYYTEGSALEATKIIQSCDFENYEVHQIKNDGQSPGEFYYICKKPPNLVFFYSVSYGPGNGGFQGYAICTEKSCPDATDLFTPPA